MEAIQKTQVNELVYYSLLANIKNNVWKSGEKIPSENDLCEMLGVSRVSIRSAIQRLRAEGLVEVWHGKGTYVMKFEEILYFSDLNEDLELTETEFNEINDLRTAIEGRSIQILAQRRKDVNLTQIESAYNGMKKSLLARDCEEYARQDYLFHASIISATGNHIFVQIINIFKSQYYKYFRELNKFIFSNTDILARAEKRSDSNTETHTILLNYLRGVGSVNAMDIMNTFTSGNRQRYIAHLSQKAEEKERKEGLKP